MEPFDSIDKIFIRKRKLKRFDQSHDPTFDSYLPIGRPSSGHLRTNTNQEGENREINEAQLGLTNKLTSAQIERNLMNRSMEASGSMIIIRKKRASER